MPSQRNVVSVMLSIRTGIDEAVTVMTAVGNGLSDGERIARSLGILLSTLEDLNDYDAARPREASSSTKDSG